MLNRLCCENIALPWLRSSSPRFSSVSRSFRMVTWLTLSLSASSSTLILPSFFRNSTIVSAAFVHRQRRVAS